MERWKNCQSLIRNLVSFTDGRKRETSILLSDNTLRYQRGSWIQRLGVTEDGLDQGQAIPDTDLFLAQQRLIQNQPVTVSCGGEGEGAVTLAVGERW
ncbi:hypothetical protein PoB_004310100 [Plakobranchus ocellatus]|uniref:Uncharacterized protein n=1 Tax=Plakobranchus ocellatus TaxID=259542 RepID=A0AAV4B821_9GAST|nr:hypothetical protein PoB_004310100 [Plakobranchus ocellatus]